ncbi:MAG: branched-chain amino acid ABC transporter substrate-binding protein [Herbaspirillum sp.]|nr:branched-chain amino acid ABC transporter substrate-binding protein [Herbaspirillum sp.]
MRPAGSVLPRLRLPRRFRFRCVAIALLAAAGVFVASAGQAKPLAQRKAAESAPAEAMAQADPAGEGEILPVGFAGPLSGPSGGVGKSMRDAVQLALDEANRRGVLIAGKSYRFRLVAQDDRADAATAEYVARYLVRQHVVGVIGHWNSGASLAAASVYHAAGVAQISPATMSRKFTAQGYPGVFRTIPNNDALGRFSAEYAARKLGVKTLATIDDRTPFGQGLAQQVAQIARDLGIEVTGSYSVSGKTSDFNAPLIEIRKRNPDLIFFGGLDWQAGLLAKAIKRLKIGSRLMASAGTIGLPFLMQAGADGNGALVLEPGLPLDRMPGWKTFRQRYGQNFDTDVDLYATFAYDAAQALVNAVRQANTTEPSAIVQELHKLRFNGVSGPISFNGEGDLLNPLFTMYEVKEMRWVPVMQINGGTVR